MPKLFRVVLRSALTSLVFFYGTSHSYGNCEAPAYREGRRVPNSASYVLLNISLRPENFAREKLICLASVLKEKYQGTVAAIKIFNSDEAALNYVSLGNEYANSAVLWASKLHAIYYSNIERHEEYLLLIPDGLSPSLDSPFNTRIDLPEKRKLQCKLQIRDRCLIEFDHISASKEYGSGAVTLTGQIMPDGTVSEVVVADPDANPLSSRIAVAEFATRNLRSWRFEPSLTKDEIRILYSVKQVDAPFEEGVDVRFSLPDRVDVQIGPVQMPK